VSSKPPDTGFVSDPPPNYTAHHIPDISKHILK